MKEGFKVIGVAMGALVSLLLVIMFAMWVFSDPFNWVVDTPLPSTNRAQCLVEKSDVIYERYSQCVKDATGNNVRCKNSAQDISCPFSMEN